MKKKQISPLDQRGFAHLLIVLIVAVFLAVGGAVYWRFSSGDKAELVNADQAVEEISSVLNEVDQKDADTENAASESEKPVPEEGETDGTIQD